MCCVNCLPQIFHLDLVMSKMGNESKGTIGGKSFSS